MGHRHAEVATIVLMNFDRRVPASFIEVEADSRRPSQVVPNTNAIRDQPIGSPGQVPDLAGRVGHVEAISVVEVCDPPAPDHVDQLHALPEFLRWLR